MAKSRSKGQKPRYNRIKEVLEEKQLSQTWLAEKLDMDFQTVTRYVNNHRQPTIARLFEIAKLLEVKVSSLLAQQ